MSAIVRTIYALCFPWMKYSPGIYGAVLIFWAEQEKSYSRSHPSIVNNPVWQCCFIDCRMYHVRARGPHAPTRILLYNRSFSSPLHFNFLYNYCCKYNFNLNFTSNGFSPTRIEKIAGEGRSRVKNRALNTRIQKASTGLRL